MSRDRIIDEDAGIDVDIPRRPRVGDRENPIEWPGIERWRTEFGRYEPAKPLLVLAPIMPVICMTPMPVDPRRPQPAMFVRIRLGPNADGSPREHILPSGVADSMCVRDRNGTIVSGYCPLHTRPVDAPDAPVHRSLLPPRAMREQRRGRPRL